MTENIYRLPTSRRATAVAAKVNQFIAHQTEHWMLTRALEQTFRTVSSGASAKIIIVPGPSAVGKTTLARILYRQIREFHAAQVKAELDFVPVLGIRAVAPHGNLFSWKDFYFRLLTQAREPLVERKLLIPREHPLFPELPEPSPAERYVVDTLRRAFEECVRRRRTKVLIIDEGHHILLAKDPARREFQFEAIKSLTIETECTIVLVGTYRLLDICEQSAQLVRRSEIVHFPAYDGEDENQVEAFVRLLRDFQGAMEFPHPVDFTVDPKYLFVKSVGCAGVLKDWLAKIYEAALLENRRTIDQAFAERFACSNRSLATMFKEAQAGVAKLRDIDLTALERALLPNIESEAKPPEAAATAEQPPRSPAQRRRVGERRPTRDPVGRRAA